VLDKCDFDRAFAAKSSAADHRIIVYLVENELRHPRLGLAVSRRVGNAIRRNRIRRCIREAFRLNIRNLPPGYDIICIARPTNAEISMADYAQSLLRLVPKASKTSTDRRQK
jgi:ribonuclease P protein component